MMFSSLFVIHLSLSVGQISGAMDAARSETVKVYSFQKGLWNKPSIEDYLRYDFNLNYTLTTYTICYWIRFETSSVNSVHLSYATSASNTNAFMAYNANDKIMVFINNKSSPLLSSKSLMIYPETWNHFCHVLNDSYYSVYWQGEVFVSGPVQMSGISMNGTLIIGQEQDEIGGGFSEYEVFRGDFTQLNIWNFTLAAQGIKKLADCASAGIGNIFNSESFGIQHFGNVSQKSVKLGELCRYIPRYLILTGMQTWSDSLTLCHRLGAEMVVPANEYENSHLAAAVEPFVDVCGDKTRLLWLGITDAENEDVWINTETQLPIQFTNFARTYYLQGAVVNCVALLAEGKWSTAICSHEKCTACHVRQPVYLYLRGLCFKTVQQTMFTSRGYTNGRIIFRGYFSDVIIWNDLMKRWQLVNTESNVTLATMLTSHEENYPLGRHQWTLGRHMCGHREMAVVNLSLSACKPFQFMCSSGLCISQSQRCDLRDDCTDGSDENECQIVITNNRYSNQVPPIIHEDSALKIIPTLALTRFSDVDDKNMVIEIELNVNLMWKDDRISFKHIKGKNTLLSDQETTKIWLPRYQFVNVKGGTAQARSATVVISTAYNKSFPNYNSVNMDKIYPGSSNFISMTHQYDERFTCALELYAYPFDVQYCHLKLRLFPSYNEHVQFLHKKGNVVYTGPEELTLFYIYNLQYETKNSSSHLIIKFQLQRRYGFIILSTFFPSVLLLVVSWATLFLSFDALNVRATMSLTTLLVLFTLFNNTVGMLPATATIKLIDIWFTFIIVLLFSNIMVHAFVAQKNEMNTFIKVVSSQEQAPVSEGPRLTISLPYRFLVIYRVLLFPSFVFIFMVVFMSVCIVNHTMV